MENQCIYCGGTSPEICPDCRAEIDREAKREANEQRLQDLAEFRAEMEDFD